MTTVKNLINQNCSFEDAAKFVLQPMELFENWRCPEVSITVYDNLSECVLNRLQFVHVETGQTSEKRVAVVRHLLPE